MHTALGNVFSKHEWREVKVEIKKKSDGWLEGEKGKFSHLGGS